MNEVKDYRRSRRQAAYTKKKQGGVSRAPQADGACFFEWRGYRRDAFWRLDFFVYFFHQGKK